MVTTPDITIRHYRPEDYPLLESWWESHGAEPMHKSMIPVSTCIVELGGEPAASGSVFPCNNNHVAFFHGMVTRPGLSMQDARECLMALQDGIDIIMRSSGHTLLLGTVTQGAMVRGAKMMGFSPAGDPVQAVARLVRPKPQTEKTIR
jgi:hypothetical protein